MNFVFASILLVYASSVQQTLSLSPRFSVANRNDFQEGQLQMHVLESHAEAETFLDRMFGTNCYTRAVKELHTDCRKMNQEQKSRLALRMANCQLLTQGQDAFPCQPHEALRQCITRLPDRENMLYIEFLTHTDTMCLFVQNREFEKYTEGMLNTLSEGAGFANEQLGIIGTKTQQLATDTAIIRNVSEEAIAKINAQRDLQEKFAQQLYDHHHQASTQLSNISAKQSVSLQLAEQHLLIHQGLASSQERMNKNLEAGQSHLKALFSMLQENTAAVATAQSSSIAAQQAMSTQLQALAEKTSGFHATISTVAEYQRRSDAALISLLGKSYSAEDVIFYATGGVAAFLIGAVRPIQHARLPVYGLLAASLFSERFLLNKLHAWLHVDAATGELMLSIPSPMHWILPNSEISLNFKWAVRRTFFALGVILLVYTLFIYQDYEKENHRILQEIKYQQKRQEEMLMQYRHEVFQTRIKELGRASRAALNNNDPKNNNENDGEALVYQQQQSKYPSTSYAGLMQVPLLDAPLQLGAERVDTNIGRRRKHPSTSTQEQEKVDNDFDLVRSNSANKIQEKVQPYQVTGHENSHSRKSARLIRVVEENPSGRQKVGKRVVSTDDGTRKVKRSRKQ